MDNQRQVQLSRLLELSEQILRCAELKEWERVMEKQRQRHTLLRSFFRQDLAEHEAPRVEDAIREIMALDRKATALAEAGKLEILRKMRNLSAGQLAIDAYANNSR